MLCVAINLFHGVFVLSKYMVNAFEYVKEEVICAQSARLSGDISLEFKFLERAHIISQKSTVLHMYVHYKMALWAMRNLEMKELAGQLLRFLGAIILTPVGLLPAGNPGGSRVPAYKTFPISRELSAIIDECNK